MARIGSTCDLLVSDQASALVGFGRDQSQALEPILGFALAAIVVLLCRWAFSTRRRGIDYGLLVTVAEPVTRAEAEHDRDLLRAAGLRATIGHTPIQVHVDAAGHAVREPERHPLLVFPGDLEAARDVLAGR